LKKIKEKEIQAPKVSNKNITENEVKKKQGKKEEIKTQQVNIKFEASLKIKPARKTPKFFINYFPEKIYCSPYKYDILIKIPTSMYTTHNILFNYLDGETGQNIKENLKGKSAVDIGKTKVTTNHGYTEIQYRVCFTVCSFHHYRRPFIFSALLQPIDKPNEEILFFQSKLFQTFARKNIKEDEAAWISEDEEEETYKNHKKRNLEDEEDEEKIKRHKKEKLILDPTNYQREGLNKMLSNYNDFGMGEAFSGFDEIVNNQ